MQKELSSYEKIFVAEDGILLKVLRTRKHELFNSWARALESAYHNGLYPNPVNTISAFIRGKLIHLGADFAVPYAREVLPAKYKRHDENPDREDFHPKSSSLNSPVNYAERNADAITHEERIIEYHTNMIKWLRTHEFLDLLPRIEWEKHRDEQVGNMNFGEQTRDDRWRVPVAFHHIVNHLIEKVNINFATKVYGKKAAEAYRGLGDRVDKMRKIIKDVSEKQFHKIGVGEVKELDELVKPRNRLEAKEDEYYGAQCPNLHWRVKYRFNPDEHAFEYYCYDCAAWLEEGDVPRMRPAVIVQKEKNSYTLNVMALGDGTGNSYSVEKR